jgi:vacuolar iron transporter family protein
MNANLLNAQHDEMNSYVIYKKLAAKTKDPANARILSQISDEEWKHYQKLKETTKVDMRPNRWKTVYFFCISKLLGLTFGIKMLEKGEGRGVDIYSGLKVEYPWVSDFIDDEMAHEEKLIEMIDEEKLKYVGSMVLGLNDALVELTGALAGFTFAFQNTRLIAVTGLITGISASLSMSVSEYLSVKQGGDAQEKPMKAAVYTGIAYVLTVAALIIPYFIFANPFVCLAACLAVAVLVIFLFNYYISVAKGTPLKKRFFEMTLISLGVAAISFLIGVLVKTFLGVNI